MRNLPQSMSKHRNVKRDIVAPGSLALTWGSDVAWKAGIATSSLLTLTGLVYLFI